MIRRPPRSTLDRSSAASDVYKRQAEAIEDVKHQLGLVIGYFKDQLHGRTKLGASGIALSLIHISEPTRPY